MLKPRMRVAAWPLLLLVIVFGGCTVGPDYVMPEYEVPDAWESAAAADVEGEIPPILDWWSAFGDPVLDTLMTRARDANLDLVIAVGRVSEARAFRAIAGGDYWPQVQGKGQYQWADNPILPNGPSDSWSFSLGALWELDLFGRVRRGAEAAGADFHAAIEDYRDVQVSLYSEVATSYVNIRALQARLLFARSNVDSQRETMEVVTAREEAGIVPRLDVARARSNLANTEAAIPSLETALASERNRLSVLLGEMPGEAGLRLGPYISIPVPPDSLVSAMPANLLRRRPDVRAAERKLAAQTARVGVATAELYPKLSLAGTVGLLAGGFSDLASEDAVAWSLTPGFSWNLFNGGKVRGQIKVQEARVDQSLANYEKTILQALGEVESALVAVKQTKIRQDLLTIAVEAAEESVTLVRTQYIEGLTDFQSYLDAQRVLFTQQDQLAETRGNVFSSVVVLNRAMGGGWSLQEPEPDIPDREPAPYQGNAPNPADDEQGDVDDANN